MKETLSVITTDAYIDDGIATDIPATPTAHHGRRSRRATRKIGIAASAKRSPFAALYRWYAISRSPATERIAARIEG